MTAKVNLPNGVIFNAYPDSIGQNLADTVSMLKRPEFIDVFSLFYILPTVFNSDLDRGFSIIDYDLNQELVSQEDLDELNKLNIMFKFDLILNHLSVGSPQFQDLLKYGDNSAYKNFFIDWNEFWESYGEMGPEGHVIPRAEHLEKLFMRKPGLPILKVRFPDGAYRPYWNTFYQEINYPQVTATDLLKVLGQEKLSEEEAINLALLVNEQVLNCSSITEIQLNGYSHFKKDITLFLEQNRRYLGQMDLNAKSQLVWDFYDEIFKKLRDHGGKLLRLDAFAYLHKEPGQINFFNKPGTWDYLKKLRGMADKYDLLLLPEIHAEYHTGLHEEVAAESFPIYDFFFPGLVIHALEKGTSKYLVLWMEELINKNIKTINMLGCHDGIPVLDLKGGRQSDASMDRLLSDEEIDMVVDIIMDRGGRVKNLFGPDGKKISYYQVNATYFSALGENEQKLRLARAIQMFMPGIPQVWYLDLFAGKNDYAAADRGGTGGHKEINRTTLTNSDIAEGLNKTVVQDQLELIRLRNTSAAFNGALTISDTDEHQLHLTWKHKKAIATLKADLRNYSFSISYNGYHSDEKVLSYC